jgi:hypothetical protein
MRNAGDLTPGAGVQHWRPDPCRINWREWQVMTYRHPRTWGVRLLVGGIAALTALTVLLFAAISDGEVLAALLFVLFAVGLGVPEIWLVSHVAREVEVTGTGIRGKPFIGRSVVLRWDDIEAAERFRVFSLDLPLPDVYRLVSRSRGTVAFTSRIERFEELLEGIKEHTHALDHLEEPLWWRKLIFRGWP